MDIGNTVYLRFKKASDKVVWWPVLIKLQHDKKLKMNVVLADSTTIKTHRHGGRLKGWGKAVEEVIEFVIIHLLLIKVIMQKLIRDPQMKLFEPIPESLIRKDHAYRKLLSIVNV